MTTITKSGVEFTVFVRDGKPVLANPQQSATDRFLASREGKDVTFKLCLPKRSNAQNKAYWGLYLTTIAEATGNTTEDLHLVLKDMFLPRKFIRLGNTEKECRKTTTDLTTAEFNLYLQQIAAWASTELGIVIPEAQ